MTTYAMRDTRDRKAGGVPVCGFALPLAAWVTMGSEPCLCYREQIVQGASQVVTDRPIVVAGAGAIGCFVGGMLAEAGARVALLARPRVMPAARIHRHF